MLRRVCALTVLIVLVSAASASAAARVATPREERGIRAALRASCNTSPKQVQVAVSTRDPRYAIYNWDDGFNATTVCSALVRRTSKRATRWRAREVLVGGKAFDRSIKPCPGSLPRDLRRTVYPRGAREPLVFCGN